MFFWTKYFKITFWGYKAIRKPMPNLSSKYRCLPNKLLFVDENKKELGLIFSTLTFHYYLL